MGQKAQKELGKLGTMSLAHFHVAIAAFQLYLAFIRKRKMNTYLL